MKRAAALAITAVMLLARPAAADDDTRHIRVAEQYYAVNVPTTWQPVTAAPGPEAVLQAFADPATSRHMTVTRVAFPNPRRTRDAYHDEVEAGLKKQATDYKRLSRKNRRVSGVPVMDLWFRHRPAGSEARELVAMRILFFRTFSLVLTVAAPERVHRAAKRRSQQLVESFVPYFAK